MSTAETRIIDPTTGGEKGQKLERFDLIPAEAARHLALTYGAGGLKYDDDNWRKGYSWRLSVGAMERHQNAWKRGESYDPELSEIAGEPVHHLAAAAWHQFTLMTFEFEGLGTDDIPERAEPAQYVDLQVGWIRPPERFRITGETRPPRKGEWYRVDGDRAQRACLDHGPDQPSQIIVVPA